MALIESVGGKTMQWGKLHLIGDQVQDNFKTLVTREIRKRRRNERQLAEHRTVKHQIRARKSCVADARSYRIARRLPVFGVAQFHPKTLIPVDGFSKLHSAWLQKFRDHEFKDWLTRKWAAGHNLLRSLQRSRVSEPGDLRR
jgi:hypothetical protein